jgi:phosphoglycerate dehydrogenase-like enzyme
MFVTRKFGLSAACLVALLSPVGTASAQVKQCPSCADGAALVARFGLREAATPVRERAGWAPPRRIITYGGEDWANALRAVAPDAVVIGVPDLPSAIPLLAGADVWVGLCAPPIVQAGSSLKWIHLMSAGADACAALPAVRQRNILLTNAQAIFGPPMSEHVLGMILSFARKLYVARDNQLKGVWPNQARDVASVMSAGLTELEGKGILIVGLGGIGTEVAKRASAFGMRVRATRNTGRGGPDYVEYVGGPNEAVELAKWADYVVNTAPLTADTRGMFNAQFFRAMKPTAFFINMGRGESVVTNDLVAALQNRTIAGAGLDVTHPEPLPAQHPLWSMPNVIITPHNGGGSDLMMQREKALAIENLRRYVNGDRMLSVVDVQRGY